VAAPFDPLGRGAGEVRVAVEPVDDRRVAGLRVVVLRVVAFLVAGFFVVDEEAVRRAVAAGFAAIAAAGVALAAAAGWAVDDRLVLGLADAGLLVATFAEAALVVAFAVADRFGPDEAAARFAVVRPADAGLAADGTAFAAAALARVPAAAARVPAAAARVPAALPAVFARVPAARPAVFARVVTAFALVPAAALALVPAARARVPVLRVAALAREVAAFRVVEVRADPPAELRPPRPRGPTLMGDTAWAAVAAADPTSIAVAPRARAPVPAAARARSPMRATIDATSAAASPAWRWRLATCLRPFDASAFASWPRRFASVARAASSCLPSFRSSLAAFPVTGPDACWAAATRSPTAPRTSAGTLEPVDLRDPFVDFAIARYSSARPPLCARSGGRERYHSDINGADPTDGTEPSARYVGEHPVNDPSTAG
jgi:hypothetical protein